MMGLHLPFVRPVRVMLDVLGLASAQLVPNAWRILMACSILWRWVLEPTGAEYPDLKAHEFLSLHGCKCLDKNLCSFSSHNKIVQLEWKYSHSKDWQSIFFFVLGDGWKFLTDEISNQEFPIRVLWSPVPDEHEFEILLSTWEEARIQLVQAWTDKNASSTWLDVILTPPNIDRFLMVPIRVHVLGREFLSAPSPVSGLKRGL